MKILILTAGNIKKMIRFHPVCFFAIVLGIIVSSFGILYYTGQLLDSYYLSKTDSDRTVKIQLEDTAKPEQVQLLLERLSKVKDNLVQEIILSEEELETSSKDFSAEDMPVVGIYNTENEERLLLGRNLTMEETERNMLVTETMAAMLDVKDIPIGQKVSADGKKYTIVGMLSYSKYRAFMLPLSNYIKEYSASYLTYVFSEPVEKDMVQSIGNIVKESDFIISYEMPKKSNPFLNRDFMLTFIQVFAIFIVAMLNILTLMSFLVKQSRRTFSVYAICGCSRHKNRCIILLQTIVLSIVSILIGSGIFFMILPALEQRGLMQIKNKTDFVMVLAMLMIGSFLFAIKLAWKACIGENIYVIKE